MTVFRTKTFRTSNPRILESTNPLGPGQQSGFTLLELIITVLFCLLILGLVSVYFSGLLSSVKLQSTVRDFSATLRQARILSKISGEPQTVGIDLTSKEYGIEGRKAKKIPAEIDFRIWDERGGEIGEGNFRLVFGSNRGLERPTFRLSNTKKTVAIQLDPLLGTVIIP